MRLRPVKSVPRKLVTPQSIEKILKGSIFEGVRCSYHRKAGHRIMSFYAINGNTEKELGRFIGDEYTTRVVEENNNGRTMVVLTRKDYR